MTKFILPIVHLVDTEGPFQEPLEETFTQLKNYGLQIQPTKENLLKIQSGRLLPKNLKTKL